jgi:hypothetical protein
LFLSDAKKQSLQKKQLVRKLIKHVGSLAAVFAKFGVVRGIGNKAYIE